MTSTNTKTYDENSETLFSIEHARKSFGDTPVLKDISLSVHRGEVVAIIGPSGGGKSTLLRCCTLLETLDGGSLRYDGITVARDNGAGKAVYGSKEELAAAREKFGLVFQNFNLFPHRTVLQNVCDAPILVHKTPRKEAEAHARELLRKMGLEGKEDMVPCELSGGQQQRVAIARALATNPEVLFFDEPTSALDPELTKGVLHVIRQLAEEHVTMVIVTHEMKFAYDVADRAIFMDGGVIVEEGDAKEVIGNPTEGRTCEFINGVSE